MSSFTDKRLIIASILIAPIKKQSGLQHGAIIMEFGQADLNSTYMWMIWVDIIL